MVESPDHLMEATDDVTTNEHARFPFRQLFGVVAMEAFFRDVVHNAANPLGDLPVQLTGVVVVGQSL